MSGQGPGERRYALQLDEGELQRYRLMAEQARAAEADLWEPAGIGPGAAVADVGCGTGAMLPALSEAVGPGGRVGAVDADPAAVAAARALVAGAGLEVAEFRGRYVIGEPPAGVRPPGWAAREAMVTAGVATEGDVRRWDRALRELEAAPVPPTFFAPSSPPSAAARHDPAPTIEGTSRPTGGLRARQRRRDRGRRPG